MPYACAVAECANTKKAKYLRGSGLIFHSFPPDNNLCNVWATKCKRKNKINKKRSYLFRSFHRVWLSTRFATWAIGTPKKTLSVLQQPSTCWLQMISRGNLLTPSEDLFNTVKVCICKMEFLRIYEQLKITTILRWNWSKKYWNVILDLNLLLYMNSLRFA